MLTLGSSQINGISSRQSSFSHNQTPKVFTSISTQSSPKSPSSPEKKLNKYLPLDRSLRDCINHLKFWHTIDSMSYEYIKKLPAKYKESIKFFIQDKFQSFDSLDLFCYLHLSICYCFCKTLEGFM